MAEMDQKTCALCPAAIEISAFTPRVAQFDGIAVRELPLCDECSGALERWIDERMDAKDGKEPNNA